MRTVVRISSAHSTLPHHGDEQCTQHHGENLKPSPAAESPRVPKHQYYEGDDHQRCHDPRIVMWLPHPSRYAKKGPGRPLFARRACGVCQ